MCELEGDSILDIPNHHSGCGYSCQRGGDGAAPDETYRFEVGHTLSMHRLRGQQSFLFEYKARPDEEAADNGEDDANDL